MRIPSAINLAAAQLPRARTRSATGARTSSGVGEFNGDRHTDLMWHHQNTGQVSFWLMKSRGIQQALVAFTVAMEWKPQRVGDFSGDGRADVLWRNTTTGAMAVWEMNGLAIVASQTLTPPSGDSRFVVQAVAGDYNGDGYGDVLWRHTNGDLMSWEMASPSAPAGRNLGHVTADWIVQNLEPRPTTTSGSLSVQSASALNGNAPWWTETPGPPFWTVGAGATVSFPSPNGPPFWAPAHGLKGPIPGPPITPPGLGGSGSGTSGPSSSSRRPSVVETNSVTAAVRHSLYTPELNLLAETTLTTGTPTIAHEYVWFAGQPIAQIDLAADTIAYTFTDHLGTPLLQTDDAATVVWRVEYEPYGKLHSHRAGATRHQPLRFPGQEYDTLAPERAYNIYRWYRGGWGRYTQADPIGLAGGDNLYVYVDGNSVNLIDPTGLQASEVFIPSHDEIERRTEIQRQQQCAMEAFQRNYRDMRQANWKQSDKYFHCKANCEATRCGPYGYQDACGWSDLREWFDRVFKNDPQSASAADQVANRFGRDEARIQPNANCQMICRKFRPRGLPAQY